MDYIAWAIPIFIGLIVIEVAIACWLGRPYYRFNDAITDISCGIGQQVIGLFFKTGLFLGYVYFYERFALIDFSTRPIAAWVAAFFGVDFLYYWWHRWSHRVNFLWAIHIVHHQSEDYNLAVALRQAWFSGVTAWVVYLPLALLGIPPLVFVAMVSFSMLYQFWIHTRLIGKLGWLEWIINTPSHHRVHHGRDAKYIDKNYGATLISWDRLFGTFQEEEEEPMYGTVKPYASWNAIWANFDYWVQLWQQARRAPYLWDKVRIWFMPPEWQPREIESPALPVDSGERIRYKTGVPLGLNGYIALQYAMLVPVLMWLMLSADSLRLGERVGAVSLILLTLLIWGGLFEKKYWALPLELGRLIVIAAVIVAYGWALPSMRVVLAAGAVLLIIFAAWLLRYRSVLMPRRQQALPLWAG